MIEFFAFNPPRPTGIRRRSAARRSPTARQMMDWLEQRSRNASSRTVKSKSRGKKKKGTKTMARRRTRRIRRNIGSNPRRTTRRRTRRTRRNRWYDSSVRHRKAALKGWAKRKGYAMKGIGGYVGMAIRKRRRPKVSRARYTRYGTLKKRATAPARRRRARRVAANPPIQRNRRRPRTYRALVKKYGVARAASMWTPRANPRRRTRRYRRNRVRYQIAPVAANRPRRRRTRRYYRRNRARYQIAPVAANRGYKYQLPGQFANNPMAAVMEFPKRILDVNFLKANVVPFLAGAVGSKVVAAQAATLLMKGANYSKYYAGAGWKKAAWEAGAGIAGGAAIGMLTKGKQTDFAMKFAAGGLLAALLTLVETSGHFKKVRELYEGKSGFGNFGADDIEEELKEKIAEELRTELEGLSGFMTADDLPTGSSMNSVGAFVTEGELPSEQSAVSLSDFLVTQDMV